MKNCPVEPDRNSPWDATGATNNVCCHLFGLVLILSLLTLASNNIIKDEYGVIMSMTIYQIPIPKNMRMTTKIYTLFIQTTFCAVVALRAALSNNGCRRECSLLLPI